MDNKNHLAFVKIIFSGISVNQLQINNNGRIIPKFPELEEQVFRVSSYVANRIFIQARVEILNLQYGIYVTPEILPERPTDEEFLAMHEIAFQATLPITWNIIRDRFQKPDDFERGFKFSKAYAHYAEGLRVYSRFLRYEQFFKIIEYFFPNGETFDAESSAWNIDY